MRWCIILRSNHNHNKVSPINRKIRLAREGYWIEVVKTSYSYGVNERKREADSNYQLDVYFPRLQLQGKDLPDEEATTILTTLKTCNLYLTLFATILQMILKMHSIISKYF